MSVFAVVPAAGLGRRMGGETPKLFLDLAGKPVLVWTLEALQSASRIDGIVLVASPSGIEYCRTEIVRRFGLRKVTDVVPGGADRQGSVRAGLEAVRGRADVVVVHDGARPLVSPALVDATVDRCDRTSGVIAAVPVRDTLKVSEEGRVSATLDRSRLWAAQTPQTFPFDLLFEAHLRAEAEGFRGTDEASLVERLGGKVLLLEGSYDNLKVTTPEDLGVGEAILSREGAGARRMRVGHGYDTHRLIEGRPLVLGGVQIPFEKGLLGHSDADVLSHAVADAVLGAMGLGDIGKLFPDTDPGLKGVSSLVLLDGVARRVREQHGSILNVDATLVAERPRIAPFVERMRQSMGKALGLPPERVSVKATTNEGMGFPGREEGMAAWAVALVEI